MKDFLSGLNRSDHCQMPFDSRTEACRRRKKGKQGHYDTISLYDTPSVAQIVTEILPLCFFPRLTHSGGMYCDFQAEECFSRAGSTVRGSLKDGKPTHCVPEKVCPTSPHFAPKKDSSDTTVHC